MRWPLQRQIMLPMAAIMLLTVIVLGGVGALLSVRATKARIATQIDDVTRILKQSNFPLTDAVLRQMKGLSGAEMAVVDDRGQIVSTSGSARLFAPLLAASPRPDVKPITIGERLWARNQGFFHTVVPLSARRGDRGDDRAEALHIFYPEVEYRRAWQHSLYPSLVFTLLALPVVMLLSSTTAARISRRMNRLQSQVDRIARGDFQQIPISDRDDEIAALGSAVNEMAAKLARYEDDVRRTERMRTLAHLGGGIAHQLRNSATGCSMALDIHAEECPTAANCESLEVARRQLQLMEEYIQRFLQLGKPVDAGANQQIDLGALVADVLPLVQPAARHARVDVEWQPPRESCTLIGDATALNQLVINLLINAVEAAAQAGVRGSAAGRVVVELSHQAPDRLLLTVSDSGPGPPSEIGNELFEPFVTAKADGVGLGLSVAREAALQHGGQISWRRAGDMTQFAVELPQVDAASRAASDVRESVPARLAGPTAETPEQPSELQCA